ncbi:MULTISPECIES: hypothetical protein [unclassified Mycoplasma]|uniref:hypothetical protein n=1 Tax=unclassified Mycoplasma TaxID=2683645 RepID=UPI00211D0204|nr:MULTISPECIES: hypothetical protein [unclassified Mycoplasma]UUM19685.1 hypothetical protein NPA11_02855 [Mycoplasma sp. 1578d]UUM24668.1 hypothetical protein NPA12_03150 [Mycoplasma sp. 3686d]
MKNSKKVLISLSSTAGIAGAASLVSIGVLLSLHKSYKIPRKQTYYFTELKNQVAKTQDALKSLTKEQQNNDAIKLLMQEVDYANQLLVNENSSIALMLEQRNKLKQDTPKTLLSVVSDLEQTKNLVEEYSSLIKDVDFQSAIKISKDKVLEQLSSPQNKNSALKAFYSFVDPLISKENEFVIGLETKIWTNHTQLIKNASNKFSLQEKSALLSAINQVLNLINQPKYSRDALVEYEKVYDSMVDKLSFVKEQENKSLKIFLENVIRVSTQINDLEIDPKIKDIFLERIDSYKKIALNPAPTLAIDKSMEIAYLNTIVDNQLETLIKESPDTNKLLETLSQNLRALKLVSSDDKIQKLVDLQTQKIIENPRKTHIEILNSISQANNLASTVKNIENLISTIKSKIRDYSNNKSLSQGDAQAFTTQLNQIIGSNLNDINEYLIKFNQLNNDIYDNVLLGSLFKNSLRKLKDQILESIDKGFNVNKKVLTQMLLEVDKVLDLNPSIKDLNSTLRIKINQLRLINRAELKNWYDSAVLILDDNDINEKIKDKLKFLNSRAIKLIPQDSTAIREELQILIRQYREEIAKSHISDGLQRTLLNYSHTKKRILDVFTDKDGNIKSDFGQKIFEQAQELRKQAKIITANPALTPNEKETKFKQFQTQLENINKNAQNFKELEELILQSEQTIESSKGKKAEQAYLEKQALKIEQIKDTILQALNQASSANNLDDLKEQLTQAIQDYKDKQAEYQSGQSLVDNFKEINEIFAPYSLGGVPTPMQQKLLNKLGSYQAELSKNTLTNEQRNEINQKIATLMDVVNSAKDLEVKNNNLKTLVSDTENNNYATFKPNEYFNRSKTLNNDVDSFLVSLFKPDFDKAQIEAKSQELQIQTNQLSLAISVALLRKTNQEILAYKITVPSSGNTNVYQRINSSIENINTQTQNLIDNPQKTQAQVDELESIIKNYEKLAKALNNSAKKLETISQSDNPITYKELSDSIINKPNNNTPNEPINSLIVFGDSISTIDFKTRILTDELLKVPARMQAEHNLTLLRSIYGTDERNRSIFDHAISAFDHKVSDYQDQISQFYTSSSNLLSLRDEIDFYLNRETANKNAINKAWDDAIKLKDRLKNEYQALKNADGITTTTHTDTVFTQFDTLKDIRDASGKKTTLTEQLHTKLNELALAYAKDSFIHTSNQLDTKLSPFNNYSNEIKTNYSDSWKTLITQWNQALRDTVNNYNIDGDLVKIKRDYQKISSLSSLISQLKTIFDYFDANSKSQTGQKNIQVLTSQRLNNTLFARLNDKTTYTGLNTSQFYNQSSESIIALRNEFRDVYFDNVSIEDAKASQKTKINEYKTNVDTKLDALANNIDTALKTQIDAKLQDLLTATNAVQRKNELIDVDNELSQIQFKEENLKNLALITKKAQNLVAANNSIPNNETGKRSIISEITNQYNAFNSYYLNLDSSNLIAREKDLEDQMSLFKKFIQVYDLVNSEKRKVPMNYATGTGNQGTPQEAKTKMQAYYDHLISEINTEPITQAKLFKVENILDSLAKLIKLQIEKLNTQNQVLTDTSYNNFAYKNATSANYGFNTDAQKIADLILKSIPTTTQTSTDIDTALYTSLVNDFETAYHLYTARKNALNQIYRDSSTLGDTGIKTKEIEQITKAGTVEAKYQVLKEKADDFFNTQAQTIANATTSAHLSNATLNSIEIDVFFEKYKRIAELVAIAKDTKNNVAQNLNSDPNVQTSMTMLQNQITMGESYYYNEKNNVNLDNNIKLLDVYNARLKLAIIVAQKRDELTKFSTTPSANGFLSAQAKAPLANILDKVFSEINANSNLETKDNYDRLLEKYVEGSSNNSFAIAFINSKILQADIYKAEQYLNKYNTHINADPNYEPNAIKTLYTNLQSKITTATNALNETNHNEQEKLNLSDQIFNSNTGALDLILKAQIDKAKNAYQQHLQLSKYLTNNFTNINVSPKISDYDAIALDPIKSIDISTADKLEAFNNDLVAARNKYEQQRVDLFKWEAHRYNSYKEKFNQFYTFLTATTTNGATQAFILETTGISLADLNTFANAINPPASDTVHNNAQTYVQKATESDNNIKTWLQTFNKNEPIETLANVADEFLNDYSNLISIKSIPSILIKISNLTRIKNELTDSNTIENARKAIKSTQSETQGLLTKINQFFTEMNTITNANQNTVKTETNEENISFANGTPTNLATERQNYFNTYKDVVVALAKAKDKLLNLVFGTSASDQDTLQKVLTNFIDGKTGFEGRADIHNLLKNIASNDQANPNIAPDADKFLAVKNEYNKLAEPSETSVHELNDLAKSASDVDIYSIITKGFDLALKLFKWTADSNNTNLFFDFLTQTQGGKANFEDIVAKGTTTVENFKNTLEGTTIPEETVTIDGVQYKAKKINDQIDASGNGTIGNLFTKFNILKGTNNFFDTNNVQVFAYKSSTDPNAEYVNARLTANPEIRKGFIKLYFRYVKPNATTQNNSAFGTVESFGIKFENVGISFNTLDTFVIHKENIQDEAHLSQKLFTAEEAGWNNLQAPSRLLSAFNKYSVAKQVEYGLEFFTEDITEPIDGPRTAKTTSSPDFRVKVQLTAPYKGYTQFGTKIYWKTLNPNFVSDTGIQYQNNASYSNGFVGPKDNTKYQWTSNYQYQYDATKDQGKNLLFLPFIIGIPVTNSTPSDGKIMMIVSWQILNRFDKNPTSTPQDISLGSANIIRRVFFFKRSNRGKTNNSTRNDDAFFAYVMRQMKYRDLEGLAFKALNGSRSKGGSRLWAADSNITTIDADSGQGGVGHADFYTAIGTNGKFDIKFKVH